MGSLLLIFYWASFKSTAAINTCKSISTPTPTGLKLWILHGGWQTVPSLPLDRWPSCENIHIFVHKETSIRLVVEAVEVLNVSHMRYTGTHEKSQRVRTWFALTSLKHRPCPAHGRPLLWNLAKLLFPLTPAVLLWTLTAFSQAKK